MKNKDIFELISKLSEEDREEIYQFAMRRSKEMGASGEDEDSITVYKNEKEVNCVGCRCAGIGVVTLHMKVATKKVIKIEDMELPKDWEYRPCGVGKAPYCPKCLQGFEPVEDEK